MKIYIVRQGWDTTDCSPTIKRIFSTRESATDFIEKDYKKELEEQSARKLWLVRKKSIGPNRWSLEIFLDALEGWVEDEVWLLEEHEVYE